MNKRQFFVFSSIDLVHQCLIDVERVSAFDRAISSAVKVDDIVLDLGSGSGILAMLAARCGARKVFAIEGDPFISQILKENIRANCLDGIIEVITEDTKQLKKGDIPTPNVVTAEMITTGLIDEDQVASINNLHNERISSKRTIIIPKQIDTSVLLANINYDLYGFKFPMIRHLWKQYENLKSKNEKFYPLSKEIRFCSIDFSGIHPVEFVKKFKITATQNGIANGAVLRSKAWLTRDIYIEDTLAMNAPVIFPIAPVDLIKDETINCEIKYTYGEGFGSFFITTKK
jgi:predicted RNA methylase